MITLPGDPALPPGCRQRDIDGPEQFECSARCCLVLSQAQWTWEELITIAEAVDAWRPQWRAGQVIMRWEHELDWDRAWDDESARRDAGQRLWDSVEDFFGAPTADKILNELEVETEGLE